MGVVALEGASGCKDSSVLLHFGWLQGCELLVGNNLDVSLALVVVHR